MKVFTTKSALLLLCLLAASCRQGQKAATLPFERRNPKDDLVCRFSGENTKLDNGATVAVIKQVALVDQRTGKSIPFQPEDAASLEESMGFYDAVWSPDGQWLVLPLGRWQGFTIIAAAHAAEELASRHYSDTIRVESANGTHLWHEFQRWDGGGFYFLEGLSGQITRIRYDIGSRAASGLPGDFVAINSRGRVLGASQQQSTGRTEQ